MTDIYDECIGDEHDHQWAGGGWAQTAGGLGGDRLHKDGAHGTAGFPIWQILLTDAALSAVAEVGHWPKDERKRLYLSILQSAGRESPSETRRIKEKTGSDDPDIVWKRWLDEHMLSQEPVRDME